LVAILSLVFCTKDSPTGAGIAPQVMHVTIYQEVFMMSRLFFGALVLGAVAIMQCGKDNPAGPGSLTPGPGYVKAMEMSYTLPGTNQITTISTSTKCNGSLLVTVFDTSNDVYFVTAESLYVLHTMGGTTDTSAAARRIGTGTGLIGPWSQYDSSIGMELLYVISSTTVQGWVKKTDLISRLRASFAAADSSGTTFTGITLDTSAADRILFTGKTTHEVVTLSIADNGAFRWSSTNASHATEDINMFAGPVTCPDNSLGLIPTWFSEFAAANTSLAKLPALAKARFTLKIFKR
jgi:hypothetical protein